MSTATTVTEVPIRLDIDAPAPTFLPRPHHLDQVAALVAVISPSRLERRRCDHPRLAARQ